MKWLTLLLAVTSGALIGNAASEQTPRFPGKLAVSGKVVMPDGSPAIDAVVTARDGVDDPPIVVRADRRGQFQIQGKFTFGCRLHARSADGKLQTVFYTSEMHARTHLASPVEMKLLPAQERSVTVLADGKAVSGAHAAVVVGSIVSMIGTTTDAGGKAILRFPLNEPVRDVVAWHPTLGVAGIGFYKHRLPTSDRIPLSGAQLALLTPLPPTIRVVDADEKPVPNVPLSVTIRMEDHWIVSESIAAAQGMTGFDGTAIFDWSPRDLTNVNVRVRDSRWKLDEEEHGRTPQDPTIVRVKRRFPVKGRLIMPPGVSADGILVKADAFGTTFCGDLPAARAAADGSFTLMVVSNHGYGISIVDSEWSSNIWTGKILADDGGEPVPVELEAYSAAPVDIVATRGALHEPVVEAWIDVSRGHSFDWLDAQGNFRGARATFSSWIQTDAGGVARAGVGRGEYELRLDSGAWEETRNIQVTGDDPLSVGFHRPWIAKRQMISGRFVLEGAPYKPSPKALLKATARFEDRAPVVVDGYLNRDGTFDIKDDTPDVSIYFVDGDRRLCGFGHAGPDEDSVTIVLAPIPPAETPGLEYCAGKTADDAVQRGEPVRAIKIYDDLITLIPDVPATFVRRGYVFAQMAKYADAIADFREAIRMDARDPGARNELAWILATSPMAAHRDGNEAFRHANAACELTQGKNPAFFATLAAALAEQGDFAQAIKGQMKAISLAAESEKSAYQKRLELYQARQPFRDEPKLVNKLRN